MLGSHEHVDSRNNEEGEDGANAQATDENEADRVARFCARPGHEDEWEVPEDRRSRGHQNGTQAR